MMGEAPVPPPGTLYRHILATHLKYHLYYWFLHKILGENPDELFDQPNMY